MLRLEEVIEDYNLLPSEDITVDIRGIIGFIEEVGVADPNRVELNIGFLRVALEQILVDGNDEISVNYLTGVAQNNTDIKDNNELFYNFSSLMNSEIDALVKVILGDLKTAGDIHFQ